MEVEPSDRPLKETDSNHLLKIVGGLGFICIVGLYIFGAFDAQFRNIAGRDIIYSDVYKKYRIEPLPQAAFAVDGVSGQMKVLDKEPCDDEAVDNVARFLSENGFKRDAATLLLGYADACPDPVWEVIYAGNYLFELGEYQEALKAADIAVHLDPGMYQAIYLRARTLRKTGRDKEAVAYYEDVIKKFHLQRELDLDVFNEMAMSYAAIGNYCEASQTLQTYIAFDKKERDTVALRQEIQNYEEKGRCNEKPIILTERLERSGGVIITDVYVNNVRGRFVVDTGASFVSLTPAFAKRADVEGNGEKVTVQTANGETKQESVILDFVSLGGLSAKQVSGTILNEPMQKAVDGLLGMSFLSRFSIAVNGDTMTLTQTWIPNSEARNSYVRHTENGRNYQRKSRHRRSRR